MPLKKHTSKKDPKQLSKKELFGPAHFTLPMIQCKSYPSFLPTKKTQENTWKPWNQPQKWGQFLSKAFPPDPSQVLLVVCVSPIAKICEWLVPFPIKRGKVTLPKTANALQNRPFAPKGKNPLPTVRSQVLNSLLVSGFRPILLETSPVFPHFWVFPNFPKSEMWSFRKVGI